MSFNAVTAGNQTLATDINQYSSALNGTTSGAQIVLNGGNAASTPYQASFTQIPTADSNIAKFYVTGDTFGRLLVRMLASGYAGLIFGNATGAASNANLYAISGGLKTDNNFTIQGAGTVNGGLTVNSITISNASTIAGNNVAQFVGGTRIYTGTATPTGFSDGDLWVKG